ncbi:MAG: ABC transporter related protein [uncultured bacterium]|nr:MAG: ABC transporter related protein [uncultured bacterium]OGH13177.1 MAG: macrolide ABC transporter ATP-binding protein [Candidatus Levybacteria bacterium RIFCSPHIGHO2_01_FULL_38_26]
MPKNGQPLIHLQDIKKYYLLGDGSHYKALNGITLKIEKGEFIAIMGPSGSGKSTLMHILGALDVPTGGKYFFNGKDIGSFSDDELAEIRNREIGFVFQAFNLLARTTVFKNVERPMMYSNIPRKEREERVMEALRLVDLSDKAHSLSNRISGGQIQRVAIARALIMDPSVILADEPTGNLDTKTSVGIMNFLKELNRKGRTIIVITHEEDIARFARRRIRLVDGKILSDKRN